MRKTTKGFDFVIHIQEGLNTKFTSFKKTSCTIVFVLCSCCWFFDILYIGAKALLCCSI